MASPVGDSHEPLAVILQPYFLNQLQLSLLKNDKCSMKFFRVFFPSIRFYENTLKREETLNAPY